MTHPYSDFPDRQFWNRAVSPKPWAEVFLGERGKFRLTPTERIASAGSCFARRIAEHLIGAGYNYEVFEPAHPLLAHRSSDQGYGVFSCRYGNVYTTRQLRQLMDEALGVRPPIFRFAQVGADRFVDLMRPNIGETGFTTVEELRADRLYHLACVRRMVEAMDTFVFTLGLTEAWEDEAARIVYGSHPAVFARGAKTGHIRPINLAYEQVVEDLEYVLDLMARHRGSAAPKVILTVSPVGLAATHQDNHVILATTYSKSVLRAAAGRLAQSHATVDYFPSFEIFSLSQSFGQYLADDLREVNGRGVAVAMRAFADMFMQADATAGAVESPSRPPAPQPTDPSPARSLAEAECDEIANAVFGPRQRAQG